MYKYNFDELNEITMFDVVDKLNIKVKTSGRTRSILCPFHDDHNPSMIIKDHYAHCYSCNKSWSVINFVKEHENLTDKEAWDWLATEFNISPLTPEGGSLRNTGGTKESKGSKEKSLNSKLSTLNSKKQSSNLNDLQLIIDNATNSLSIKAPTSPISDGEESYAFNIEYLVKHLSMKDSFCKCLLHIFDAPLVSYVAEMYGIGCWAVDDTMFPVIDKDLNVHNIKIQHYDTNIFSETFFHKDKGAAWWYAKKYIETHKDIPGTRNDVNCYFGEHLISRFPNATIILVESPKNAVLGTCVWPQYVWVAAGNKGMLNRERLKCLRGRKVIVMPDADAAEEWRNTLSKMQDIATFVISEMVDEFGKIGPKADVGDWIVKVRFKMREMR